MDKEIIEVLKNNDLEDFDEYEHIGNNIAKKLDASVVSLNVKLYGVKLRLKKYF